MPTAHIHTTSLPYSLGSLPIRPLLLTHTRSVRCPSHPYDFSPIIARFVAHHTITISLSYSLGSLPTITLRLLPSLLRTSTTGPFRDHAGYSVLVSYRFARLCESHGYWRFILSYGTSQRQLSSTVPFPSCFLHNPKFRQGDCFAGYLLSPWFLACLFFDPEDGGDMFLRNIGWLSADYTALYPRR
jgi:hypothetical protein